MNSVNITGRLTHDMEAKVVANGEHVADFQIAIRDGKDKQGNEKTSFIRCQAWGKMCEIMERFASKGSNLAISGTLKCDRYQDKNGKNVEKTFVRVNTVEVLDHRKTELEKDNQKFGYSAEDQNKEFVESVQGTEYADKFGTTYDEIKSDDLPFY